MISTPRRRAKTTLTDRAIKALKPNGKKQRIRDHIEPGFGVRMTPAGAISFFFSYTFARERKEIAIGRYPSMDLKTARTIASTMRGQICQGINPLLDKQRRVESEQAEQAARNAEKIEITIGALIEGYIDHLDADSSKKGVRRILQIYIDTFGSRRARSITTDELMTIITRQEKESPASTKKQFDYLHAAFNYARRVAKSRTNPAYSVLHNWQNPLTDVPKPGSTEARNRFLSVDEIRILWKTTAKTLHRPAATIIRLILLTGQRVEEVAGMRWSEIDEELSLWTIPPERIKTGKKRPHPHVIPLAKETRAIIMQQKKSADVIFPGKNGKSPLSTKAIRDYRDEMIESTKMEWFQPRDLRRTVKTHLARIGISEGIRNRLQNHSLSDLASVHYDKHDYLNEKLDALKQWNSEISRIARS